MLLIPEAWQNANNMNKRKKDFYKYYSQFSEPWDGPAAVAFTDGKKLELLWIEMVLGQQDILLPQMIDLFYLLRWEC